MNHYIRVNIGFGTGLDHVVEETATHVLVGLKDNTAYTALPVTLVALQALLTAFINAMRHPAFTIPTGWLKRISDGYQMETHNNHGRGRVVRLATWVFVHFYTSALAR